MKAAKYWQLASHTGLALSAFVIAYLLLRYAPAAHYGSFTFMLVLQAFGMALCNALIASPLLILMNTQQSSEQQAAVPKGFLLFGLAIATGIALLQGLYLWFALADIGLSVLLAVAGWLQLLRWYVRCEWQNRNVRVLIFSDGWFSLLLVIGCAVLWYLDALTLFYVGGLLILASIVALWPFLAGFYHSLQQPADWSLVSRGFQKQGKPALLGVFTVELTANFHSYLVVLGSGSAAFAPLAAAMLFFRPLAVVLGSLIQSERPMLVQARNAGKHSRVQQLTASIRNIAIVAFLGNVLVLLLVFMFWPILLWPEPASRTEFGLALILWSLVALFRALRASTTAWMQAADQFAPLARVTYLSAAWTIPAVVICWWLAGPIASLLGVLSGEVLLGILLWRVKRKLQSTALIEPASI
ncbi:MAG: hypothetical protein ACK4NN_11040 [Rheinheimera sp.]